MFQFHSRTARLTEVCVDRCTGVPHKYRYAVGCARLPRVLKKTV